LQGGTGFANLGSRASSWVRLLRGDFHGMGVPLPRFGFALAPGGAPKKNGAGGGRQTSGGPGGRRHGDWADGIFCLFGIEMAKGHGPIGFLFLGAVWRLFCAPARVFTGIGGSQRLNPAQGGPNGGPPAVPAPPGEPGGGGRRDPCGGAHFGPAADWGGPWRKATSRPKPRGARAKGQIFTGGPPPAGGADTVDKENGFFPNGGEPAGGTWGADWFPKDFFSRVSRETKTGRRHGISAAAVGPFSRASFG